MKRPLHLALPVGTKVLTRAGARAGLVTHAPATPEHGYRIRFADGGEGTFHRNEWSTFKLAGDIRYTPLYQSIGWLRPHSLDLIRRHAALAPVASCPKRRDMLGEGVAGPESDLSGREQLPPRDEPSADPVGREDFCRELAGHRRAGRPMPIAHRSFDPTSRIRPLYGSRGRKDGGASFRGRFSSRRIFIAGW